MYLTFVKYILQKSRQENPQLLFFLVYPKHNRGGKIGGRHQSVKCASTHRIPFSDPSINKIIFVTFLLFDYFIIATRMATSVCGFMSYKMLTEYPSMENFKKKCNGPRYLPGFLTIILHLA